MKGEREICVSIDRFELVWIVRLQIDEQLAWWAAKVAPATWNSIHRGRSI
jgi:hypothetical protein